MRLSFRADRADLVLEGLLQGIDDGGFIDAYAESPGWGSLTALLRRRGWVGLHLVADPSMHDRFLANDPSCRVITTRIGPCAPAADDAAAATDTVAGLWKRHGSDRPLRLLCLGAATQPLAALLGAELQREPPWFVAIERAGPAGDRGSWRPWLRAAGYVAAFEGPLVEVWASGQAPAAWRAFSYAAAVVMPGPAMPSVLLPRTLQVEELLRLDDQRFVTAAYWSVLGRAPDEGGQQHYEAVLRAGGDRLTMLRDMANSGEALARGVGVEFRQLARDGPRPVQGARTSWWRRLLRATGRRHGGAALEPLARLAPAYPMRQDIGQTATGEQQMDWPHYKISYAQNFEDLVLAGLLKSVSGGFYVDVGANHPELDSVTKIFYDKGWRGINVEPNDALHRQLVEQRPRDINVKAAASSQPGSLTLRIYEGLDGLSTISRETQAAHAASQPTRTHRDVTVPVVCLADLLAEHRPSGDVHFLKVDVEGLELEVLLGNDWARFRPWVLCLERNLQAARQEAIGTYLRELGYQAVFWDGINDFFVADERREIWHSFSYANDVVLNGVPVNYIFIRTMVAMAKEAAGRG